jgi:pre-rRNA-processing protein TSR4
MVLLLQLNGDLPEFFPGHERRLYVLCCRRKTCRRKDGSVRVLRGTRIFEVAKDKKNENKNNEAKAEVQPGKSTVNIGESLFGAKPSSSSGSVNPFSTNGASSAPSNPFSSPSSAPSNPFAAAGLSTSKLAAKPPQAPQSPTTDLPKTFASALNLNLESPQQGPAPPPEPWPEESALPSAYPLYYLVDADYEILDKAEDVAIPTTTMDLEEGSGGGSQKEDKDVYESTIDKTFQKFADRLAQNPEQVIRYEFKGQPLLYSKHDAVGKLLGGSAKDSDVKIKVGNASGGKMPRCGNCGGGRVFEVQLTPHAIMELESDEMGIDGMEWGTIIVGVCEKDCAQRGAEKSVGYLEEWAGVQWEELSERR